MWAWHSWKGDPLRLRELSFWNPGCPPQITFLSKRETRAVIMGVHSCAAKGDVGIMPSTGDVRSVSMMLHLPQMGHMF